MCGIVGVIGNPQAVNIVVQGLKRLEYRGYDSAGLAVLNASGQLQLCKATGKLHALEEALAASPVDASSQAIGHTRWATHGVPSNDNAHPHVSTPVLGPRVAVVHNGIIENYQALRSTLGAHGVTFASQTDTEVLPYSISHRIKQGMNLTQAVRNTCGTLTGSFAFVAMEENNPTMLVGTRRGAPLCVGLAESANYLCSDPLALAGLTNKFIFIEDGDVATITPQGVKIIDANGVEVIRPIKTLDLTDDLAGKQGYRHFMLKEINEQPAVFAKILENYTHATTQLPSLPITATVHAHTQINIVACGTAYYASLVGKYLIEQLAGVPVNVDVASEFRYRNPPLLPGGIFIAVSQSGETADTLAALEHAKAAGQHIIALTNVPTSSIGRAAHDVIDLVAGREIAVASTKAFTAMVLLLQLLGLQLAQARGIAIQTITQHVSALRQLPPLCSAMLNSTDSLHAISKQLQAASNMLYLGRGLLAPLALEGALKMKEISYIHAEGYASGEMKHGPIALVDKSLPVINLAVSSDNLFDKTISNLKEVEARQGQVYLITDAEAINQLDDTTKASLTLIQVPTVPALLAPIIFAIPLQLLAYFTATEKGTDVDQPRNLAKSVTVE